MRHWHEQNVKVFTLKSLCDGQGAVRQAILYADVLFHLLVVLLGVQMGNPLHHIQAMCFTLVNNPIFVISYLNKTGAWPRGVIELTL